MKIVQALGWYFPESIGGTEVYVAALARRLVESGHTVSIAAPDALNKSERHYEHEGIPVYRYPIPAEPSRDECRELVSVKSSFITWLHDQQPDVVHFHTFVTGLGIIEVEAAKSMGARVIVTTHSSSLGYLCQRGTMMRWGEAPCDGIAIPSKCAPCELQHRGLSKLPALVLGSVPPLLGEGFSRIEGKIGSALAMGYFIAHNQEKQKRLLKAADKFVLLTQWAFNAVAANGAPPNRIALNRLGLSQEVRHRKPGPDLAPTARPVRIGYLGRFEFLKGVEHLARAAKSIDKSVGFSLEFRGPVTSPSEKRQVDELKIIVGDDPRVSFAPAVSSKDVPSVLCNYDVLCCPSVCLEGGPTVAIEAQAVGTPVVGSNLGGLRELVSDGRNGRLIPPGDVAALTALITEIASGPEKTIDVWRNNLPAVRTMDDVTRDYLELYKP